MSNIRQIKLLYHGCVVLARTAKRYDMAGRSDLYYETVEALNSELSKLARENFVLLTKPELLRFLSLCSSYRPLAPHSLLTIISMQYEALYTLSGNGDKLKESNHA